MLNNYKRKEKENEERDELNISKVVDEDTNKDIALSDMISCHFYKKKVI